jgi:hypothetical protein
MIFYGLSETKRIKVSVKMIWGFQEMHYWHHILASTSGKDNLLGVPT